LDNNEIAHLWINGKYKQTFAKNGLIFYNDKVTLADFAKSDGKAECLSYWQEKGQKCASYNSAMHNGAITLIRNYGNIEISANLYFIGSLSRVREPTTNQTYETLAFDGIARVWKNFSFVVNSYTEDGTFDYFGDVQKVDVKFNLKKLTSIEAQNTTHLRVAVKERGQPITWRNLNWNVGALGKRRFLGKNDIELFKEFKPWFSKKIQIPNVDQFKNLAAHEFGHILGLGDAYTDSIGGIIQIAPPVTPEIPDDEIMRSKWNRVMVYPNTIEMILEAFKLNRLQIYDPTKSKRSKAIKLNEF